MIQSETICAKDGLYEMQYALVEKKSLYGLQITEVYDGEQKTIKTVFPLSDQKEEMVLLQKTLEENCVFLLHVDAVLEDMGYLL